ncbi:GYDIA family GHMP kinase [Algibacter mikhailovii]|uniref:GHMP kinase n=1 Tax=Algibacter mikhailovii TaxID=425498 RepID=A0A918R189_9FLAO|nr:GYDIA family GHMP kinase [Algibacter mikhailovii]GGZ78394.1 hypothetical protein GCM10007028_14780 [Algibacter mikhailovii]
MKSKTFYSNGKLLISGEYVILDGAKALALPTKQGQSLNIEPINDNRLLWESFDHKGDLWFSDVFEIKNGSIESRNSNEITQRLIQILQATFTLNPAFIDNIKGFKVTTLLDFPTNWGLGTSSTLINNIAQWAEVSPYKLLSQTFGGSGYDIACAQHSTGIIYQIENEIPTVTKVEFNPNFKNNLFFIHLNKKQNSRAGIKHYHENKKDITAALAEINDISMAMVEAKTLDEFEHLIHQHEGLIAKITNQTPVKSLFFKDFNGAIKSLGAWGGDFVLAASKEDPTPYFNSKGYHTVLPFNDIILN